MFPIDAHAIQDILHMQGLIDTSIALKRRTSCSDENDMATEVKSEPHALNPHSLAGTLSLFEILPSSKGTRSFLPMTDGTSNLVGIVDDVDTHATSMVTWNTDADAWVANMIDNFVLSATCAAIRPNCPEEPERLASIYIGTTGDVGTIAHRELHIPSGKRLEMYQIVNGFKVGCAFSKVALLAFFKQNAITVHADGHIVSMDLASPDSPTLFNRVPLGICGIAVNPKKDTFYTMHADGGFMAWDHTRCAATASITAHPLPMSSMCLHGPEELITTCDSGEVKFKDMARTSKLHTCKQLGPVVVYKAEVKCWNTSNFYEEPIEIDVQEIVGTRGRVKRVRAVNGAIAVLHENGFAAISFDRTKPAAFTNCFLGGVWKKKILDFCVVPAPKATSGLGFVVAAFPDGVRCFPLASAADCIAVSSPQLKKKKNAS